MGIFLIVVENTKKMNNLNNTLQLISVILVMIMLSSCGNDLQLNKFPTEDYTKVIAYKMKGFDGEVIEKGKLSSQVVGKGEVLTVAEAEGLIKIFHNTSTYGEKAARCFEPHIGYVFYGNNNKIVGHSTICLTCN